MNVLSSMYSDITYAVKCSKGIGQPVCSRSGVKQGCVSSPTLFNIYLNDLKEYLDPETCELDCEAPVVGGVPVTHLLFADDLVLLSSSMKGLRGALTTSLSTVLIGNYLLMLRNLKS
jgi:hypothetical protein